MSLQITLTVDIVVFDADNVLLIQRRKPPYESRWALPGGKVEEADLTLEDAANRELKEEAGIVLDEIIQIGTFGDIGRDPRPGRWVSIAFLAIVGGTAPKMEAGGDAADARWFPLNNLPALAFDHAKIIAVALKKIKTETIFE